MKTGLLIVSYGPDLPFFGPLARSIKKFATGFSGVKVVVPNRDVAAFRAVAEPCGIQVAGFDEEGGKGFLSHLRMKCYADHHFPDCDAICHLDSDCAVIRPWHASELFHPKEEGVRKRVIMPCQKFSSFLRTPTNREPQSMSGVLSSELGMNNAVYFWRFVSEIALGFEVPYETMRRMPITHVRGVYTRTREVISERFGNFDRYLMSCRNSYPQTFCEFNTLGGAAHKFFRDEYLWQDVEEMGWPPFPVVQSWSKNPKGLDGVMSFPQECGGPQTARQLYSKLGIL